MTEDQLAERVNQEQADEQAANVTLEAMWAAYRVKCVPPKASGNQVTQTKAAFFAGAHSLLILMLNMIRMNRGIDEELSAEAIMESVDRLKALHTELHRFIEGGST